VRNSTPRRAATSLVVLAALASPAAAHQASVVYADITVDGRTVSTAFHINGSDVGPAIGLAGERAATREQVAAAREQLLDYVAAHVTVDNGGARCEPRPRGVGITDKGDGFFADVALDFACKTTAANVRVDYRLFFDLDPRHQCFATVGERQWIFRADDHVLDIARPTTLWDHVRDYALLGVEHIFTGYDHLAFLFGLLVVAGFASLRSGLRYVLGVVTAFTVAHSITLIASGLDWVRLPPRFVEPAIALSIFYVAVENLFVRTPRLRWLLTFGFGLVHGFGFASVLREIGLPPRGLVLSLLSFNVGVEAGQLAVVAAMAPLLRLLTRGGTRAVDLAWVAALALGAFLVFHQVGLPSVQLALVVFGVPTVWLVAVPRFGYDRAVRTGGSVVLAALAAFWFFERILEKSWLGGVLG
jgi:hypothetical protein